MNRTIKLTDLGYDAFFESGKQAMGVMDYPVARVLAEYKEAYRVKNAGGEFLARITGKQRSEAKRREDYPAVGDWVALTELPDGKAVIHAILPRRTTLRKQYGGKQEAQIIAANIDVAFIVESMDRDYNLNRFDRFLVLAHAGGIEPVLVLNKIDVLSGTELESRINRISDRYSGTDIICSSTVSDQGMHDFDRHLSKGKTYCFLGSSGVGKSSLINKLLGTDEIRTGAVNAETERGRHTTTTREMYFLENGSIVIDNPGTRSVGIVGSDIGLSPVFDDIGRLSRECRFANCSHTHEPGCAVLAALEHDAFDADKYENYVKLRNESEYYNLNEVEKREKDRRFGKMLKNYHDLQKRT